MALVFCDGCADDLYTRQFDDRSRSPADVVAEKVDVGTTVDVPIVRSLKCKSRVFSEVRWDMPDGIWPVR